MIINKDYFLNKSVYIPNVVAQPSIGSATPTAADAIDDEISERETELMIAALGFEQYEEMMAQLQTSGSFVEAPSVPVQKWVDLIDGKEYDGKKWNGLRYERGGKKISLIANYVFFYYLKGDFSTYTTTGVQVAEAENAIRQAPNQKQAEAWNKFVSMYNGHRTAGNSPSFFSNWNGYGITWGSNNGNEVSMYEFLTDHSDDYDTSFFTFKTVINPSNL